ncbi:MULTISPECIES: hypothetical protein [unclassified Streptomyces]|uniref:hypothetical protein n=1 Tax=unclassified Streptomyces TaxID=2593676 RepID=UPI0037FDB712
MGDDRFRPRPRIRLDRGWDVRLYWRWIGCNTLAFIPVLTTTRWKWWIGANLASWLIVDAIIYLLSRWASDLGVLTGDGSLIEVYLTLIATTPLTGRALLWVLAPSALTVTRPPQIR